MLTNESAYTQHRYVWGGGGDRQTLRSESRGLARKKTIIFSSDFLPAMASDHSFVTYKLELLKSR